MKINLAIVVVGILGVILIFLSGNFSIGSKEYWHDALNNNLGEVGLVRIIFSSLVGLIWSIISFFIISKPKSAFLKYISLFTLFYTIISVACFYIFYIKNR